MDERKLKKALRLSILAQWFITILSIIISIIFGLLSTESVSNSNNSSHMNFISLILLILILIFVIIYIISSIGVYKLKRGARKKYTFSLSALLFITLIANIISSNSIEIESDIYNEFLTGLYCFFVGLTIGLLYFSQLSELFSNEKISSPIIEHIIDE